MIYRDAADSVLKRVVFATLTVMVALQILVWRPLFADGAFLLQRILDTRRFHDSNEPSRVFDYWFTQFPTVFAVKLGLTDLHALTYIFCAWMILCWMLPWFAALALLRRDRLFWPFVAMFIIAYFNGGFFTVGEYNLDYALSALCFAIMLRREYNSRAAYSLLLSAALLSVMTYASTMFLGGLLAVVAFQRLRMETSPSLKKYWLTLIGIFAASAAVGLWGYLLPNHPLNKQRASDLGVLLWDRQYWSTLGFAALAAAQLFIPARPARDALAYMLILAAVLTLTGLVLPHPVMDFAIRVYTGLALCAGFAAIAWFRFYGYCRVMDEQRLSSFDPVRHCAVPLTVLLLALSFFDLQRSRDFGPYLDEFRDRVNAHTGIIPWEQSMALVPHDRAFGWSWTYPSMSILLRRDANAAIIRNAERSQEEQPFSPEHPPDLSRYYPNR